MQSRMEHSVVKVTPGGPASCWVGVWGHVGHGQVHTHLESEGYWVLVMSVWAGNGESLEVFKVL